MGLQDRLFGGKKFDVALDRQTLSLAFLPHD